MRSPHAYHRPVANAYLERVRDRRLKRELLAMLAAVLALGGGLLAYTWVHTETLRVAYDIERLEQQLGRLEEQARALRLQVSSNTQPQRIEARARRELGMHPPSQEQTLYFEELLP